MGSAAASGALHNGGNRHDSGHVRLYRNVSGTWTQIGQDIDGEVADDKSGWSVALSSDGTVVAIGAWSNDGNGNDSGHVRLYRRTTNAFTFDPGDDFQDLAPGQTRDATFQYTATDNSNAANATSQPATVTVTVTGVDDPAVATAEIGRAHV